MGRTLNITLGTARAEVDAQLGADHQEGIAHVALLLAQVGEFHALGVAELLAHGEDVGKCLGGVELIRQAVPHGNTGLLGEFLDNLLVGATILDAVVHTAEHAGGILDGLLLAHLRRTGIEIGHTHAEVHGTDLEGAAGARGGLFKQQDDVLALEVAVRGARALQRLEVSGELQQVLDFLGREVEKLEKMTTGKIQTHDCSHQYVVLHG